MNQKKILLAVLSTLFTSLWHYTKPTATIVSDSKILQKRSIDENLDDDVSTEINAESINISLEINNQLDYYDNLLKNTNDIETKDKIQDLINADKRLLNDYNNSLNLSSDENEIMLASASYASEISLVNAYFQSCGYVLASELLLHAYSNGEVDSQYTPVNKDIITTSTVFQQIKTGSSLSGSSAFPNSGTTQDKDLYYAIHAFNYLKSPTGRVVNISDRYDYAKSNNYPSIAGVAVNWMYNAQEAGVLTPFITSVSFNYDDMEVSNTTTNISIGYFRFKEFPMGIGKKETRTFNITFTESGYKVMQTFGLVDTVMSLYDSNDNLITTNDDGGSGTNSYIMINARDNTTYKLVIKYFSTSLFGATKLVITNSFYDKISNSESMSSFTDIYSISHENFYWYSYVGEHYSHLLRIIPPSRGIYQLDATSEFDNYMYIIDPRSGFGLDSDNQDDDSGDGLNARITKYLNAGTNYLVIYCQYNPNATFSNYDTGDDLLFHVEKIESL